MGTPDDRFHTDSISDGYHTFGELYEHRAALLLMLMTLCRKYAWFSLHHHDGESIPGFFLAGINLPNGPISYHLRESPWLDILREAQLIQELPLAPPWDGHMSSDVLARLTDLIRQAPAALEKDVL
jgi:Ser/Thr protein kinase RdoA (MazF antagonist)